MVTNLNNGRSVELRVKEQGLAGSIPDVEVVRRVVGGDTYFRNLSDA